MEWIIMSDELEHTGKRGMHWGERNYQRKDGTWTPLGLRLRRIREGGSGSKRKPSGDAQKRAERKNEIKNLQSKAELDSARAAYKINKAQNKSAVQTAKAGAASIGNKIKDATKKAVEAHKEKKREESVEEIIRSGDLNKILSSKTKLTEDELRTAVNRLRLEQDLKDAGDREKARGQATVKRFTGAVGDIANFTKNGIAIYNNIATVINTFLGKDLKTIGGKNKQTSNTNQQNHNDDNDDNNDDNNDNDVAHGNVNDVTNTLSNDNNQSSNGGHNNQHSSNQQSSNSSQTSNNTHGSSHHQQSSNSSQSSNTSSNDQSSTSNQSANTQSSSHQQSSNSNQSSGWSPQRQAESQSRLNSAMTNLAHANALMTAARDRYGANSSQAMQMEQLYRAANTVATAARTSHNEVVNSNPVVQAENRRQAIRDIANMPVQDAVHAVTHRASTLTLSRAVREARRQQAEYEAQQAIQRLDDANNLLNNVNMDNWRRSLGLDDDYR